MVRKQDADVEARPYSDRQKRPVLSGEASRAGWQVRPQSVQDAVSLESERVQAAFRELLDEVDEYWAVAD